MAEPERLNRAGRPWGVPRAHVNKHGVPKRGMPRAEAVGLALQYTWDSATDPEARTPGRVVEAYECPVCGLWHVGGLPLWLRRQMRRAGPAWVLWEELGPRVYWNLEAENRGKPQSEFQRRQARTNRALAIARRFPDR